ncbi:MAG: acyl-protein synthetase [Polyangiaceae bacterium]|nr:acyl-protein synthetase [Polyangiaceae bacterium]
MSVTVVDESEALHARVRAFVRGGESESFDPLALDLARFQARWSPGYRRLCALRGEASRADQIPAVPTDAFRLTRVAVHPPELDAARFATSGTTGSDRGVHVLRTLDTYAAVALASGRRALCPPDAKPVVVALARDPGDPGESSLGYMMRLFMRTFDGAGRDAWLIDGDELRMPALEAAVDTARSEARPLLVLAPAFALVALVERLGPATLRAPEGSRVMQTGGFKGRTHEVDPAALYARVARAFGGAQVIGEYGMTELSSQLYEAEPGVYVPPRWLRVTPVDPVSLVEVPDGEVGLARFVDLANVDSAVAVLTQDQVRRRGSGIELLGRRPGAPARGCSLSIEAMLG